MARPMKIFAVAGFSVVFTVSVASARQMGAGPGNGRKHHDQKANAAAPTAAKAVRKHTMLLSKTYRTNLTTRGPGPARIRDDSRHT
jgi:hypothetical protein